MADILPALVVLFWLPGVLVVSFFIEELWKKLRPTLSDEEFKRQHVRRWMEQQEEKAIREGKIIPRFFSDSFVNKPPKFWRS